MVDLICVRVAGVDSAINIAGARRASELERVYAGCLVVFNSAADVLGGAVALVVDGWAVRADAFAARRIS